MTLEPEDLEDTFRRYHAFHDAITAANRAAQPKQSIWPSVAKLFMKAIPADLVRTMIVDGGKAILAKRRESSGEDQPPVKHVQTKAPPAPPSDGPRQPAVSGLVGTFVEPEKPTPAQE